MNNQEWNETREENDENGELILAKFTALFSDEHADLLEEYKDSISVYYFKDFYESLFEVNARALLNAKHEELLQHYKSCTKEDLHHLMFEECYLWKDAVDYVFDAIDDEYLFSKYMYKELVPECRRECELSSEQEDVVDSIEKSRNIQEVDYDENGLVEFLYKGEKHTADFTAEDDERQYNGYVHCYKIYDQNGKEYQPFDFFKEIANEDGDMDRFGNSLLLTFFGTDKVDNGNYTCNLQSYEDIAEEEYYKQAESLAA